MLEYIVNAVVAAADATVVAVVSAVSGATFVGGGDDKDNDKTFENESTRDTSPMVRISINEYNELRDQAKEASKYITDPSLIAVIDKIEELTRALRKHIVRKYE